MLHPRLDGLFLGRSKGVFLENEECSQGLSVYDYPLMQSTVGSAPSERLQEGSQFG